MAGDGAEDGQDSDLSGRDRALLRAVAAGRCLLGSGCEPVLLVDGLACADSSAGRRLVSAGLIRAVAGEVLGAVTLTSAGRRALLPVPVAR